MIKDKLEEFSAANQTLLATSSLVVCTIHNTDHKSFKPVVPV